MVDDDNPTEEQLLAWGAEYTPTDEQVRTWAAEFARGLAVDDASREEIGAQVPASFRDWRVATAAIDRWFVEHDARVKAGAPLEAAGERAESARDGQ